MNSKTFQALILGASLLASCGSSDDSCYGYYCWESAAAAGYGTECWHLSDCYYYYYTFLGEDGESITLNGSSGEVEWSTGLRGEVVESSDSRTMRSWSVSTESGSTCIIAHYHEGFASEVVSMDGDTAPGNYWTFVEEVK